MNLENDDLDEMSFQGGLNDFDQMSYVVNLMLYAYSFPFQSSQGQCDQSLAAHVSLPGQRFKL